MLKSLKLSSSLESASKGFPKKLFLIDRVGNVNISGEREDSRKRAKGRWLPQLSFDIFRKVCRQRSQNFHRLTKLKKLSFNCKIFFLFKFLLPLLPTREVFCRILVEKLTKILLCLQRKCFVTNQNCTK